MTFLSERFAPKAIGNYDICIIGGGAAGLVLFSDLLKRKHLRVILCEGGAETPTEEMQNLFRADYHVGFSHLFFSDPLAPTRTRLRMLGGTTGHWGRQLMEFDPIDFSERPWVPHSGWPIDKPTIAPWYHRAKEYFGLSRSDSFEAPL